MSFAQRFLNSAGGTEPALSTPEAPRGCYLSDGLHLYLALGAVGDGTGLVGLEDCYTLEVILVPIEELDFLEVINPQELDASAEVDGSAGSSGGGAAHRVRPLAGPMAGSAGTRKSRLRYDRRGPLDSGFAQVRAPE